MGRRSLDASQGGTTAQLVGSGYYLAVPCEMTAGASGGPVFEQFSDGTWGISGVVNIEATDPNTQLGQTEAWQWSDGNFTAFYCSVFQC